MDINWDYKEVEISTDIISEYLGSPAMPFRQFVFDKYNHDEGQLFIDFQADFKHLTRDKDPKCIIKYGFFVNHTAEKRVVFDPDEFMQQSYMPDPEEYNYSPWRSREYYDHCINFTERNIRYIQKRTRKMTDVEALEFMEYDYEKDLGAYRKL